MYIGVSDLECKRDFATKNELLTQVTVRKNRLLSPHCCNLVRPARLIYLVSLVAMFPLSHIIGMPMELVFANAYFILSACCMALLTFFLMYPVLKYTKKIFYRHCHLFSRNAPFYPDCCVAAIGTYLCCLVRIKCSLCDRTPP